MQNINVNITPDNYPQSLYFSQNDVGREFKINITDFTIPVGATVKIQATKPSGFGFSVSGTVSGNSVTFETTDEMTDEAGRFPAELVVESGSVVIGTANFLMVGEANPHPEGTTDGSQGTIIPELTLLVERVETAASKILDMQVVANTLPAGSQATYSYDEDLNKATFGIPEGQAGAGAAGVVASAYSAAKTYKVGDYVLYNSNLYRCTTAITTAEAWTAAHWTQVVLADDVSDVKTDLFLESILKNAVGTHSFTFDTASYIVYSTGKYYSGSTGSRCTVKIPLLGFKKLQAFGYSTTAMAFVAFYDKDLNYLQSISVQGNGASSGQHADIDLTSPTYASAVYAILSIYPTSIQAYCRLIPNIDLANFEENAMKFMAVNGSDYNNNLASFNKTAFIQGSTFEDVPPSFVSTVTTSYKHATNYALQVMYNLSTGYLATRVVNCTDGTVYRDWKVISTDDYEHCRILCVGDSIAYGMRNNQKGFVGDLGVTYANKAISMATLSNYSEPSIRSIPRQLVEAYGNIDFYPDNIIAEGGINDYGANVPLGTMSTRPVANDTEANALDRDTVIGATEYLFYQMIKLYPKAHRFFLITHKTLNYPYTDNSVGYNQQDLHDALVACCKLYNVEVIDVYDESVINTQFSAYVSSVAWSDDPTMADNEYVDSDGVHPCKYGYAQGYVPLVKRALKIGVRNH